MSRIDFAPDAHRLAMELECLLLECADTRAVSKWWDSANDALDQHRALCAAIESVIDAHKPVGYGLFVEGKCLSIGQYPSSGHVGGKSYKSHPLYTTPQQCPRCQEFEGSPTMFAVREAIQSEALKENERQSERIKELEAENARLMNKLGIQRKIIKGELKLLAAERNDRLQEQLAELEAQRDRLMLEYCPDEITPEQIEKWGDHQGPVDSINAERKR